MPLVPLGDGAGHDAWTVAHGERSFAVFRVGGALHVTDARCPHNGGPLEQGWLREGRTVTCPWHWFRFDLQTGRCLTAQRYALATHPVVEVDGAPYAEVPDPAPARSWSDLLRAHARGEA